MVFICIKHSTSKIHITILSSFCSLLFIIGTSVDFMYIYIDESVSQKVSNYLIYYSIFTLCRHCFIGLRPTGRRGRSTPTQTKPKHLHKKLGVDTLSDIPYTICKFHFMYFYLTHKTKYDSIIIEKRAGRTA